VTDADPERRKRREVRRGEGEVTQWPRGLEGYVPKGPADETPSPEEDRTLNRIRLASRLVALLASQGRVVDEEMAALREAESAYRAGDRRAAASRVDSLLALLDENAPGSGRGTA
jgi:hypothetical protein